jgi:hypothetical protein
MLWAVRGTLRNTDEDVTLVVEAENRDAAEYMGLRRNITVVIVDPASESDIAEARRHHRLFRYTVEHAYRAFGRPVPRFELAGLLMCGALTILLLLRTAHLPFLLG